MINNETRYHDALLECLKSFESIYSRLHTCGEPDCEYSCKDYAALEAKDNMRRIKEVVIKPKKRPQLGLGERCEGCEGLLQNADFANCESWQEWYDYGNHVCIKGGNDGL